jgi:hypothetical protein
MDKLKGSSNAGLKDDAATEVARSVERDFTDLVAIFDLQLDSLPSGDGVTRQHVAAARSAAERGLKLSRELISKLQD